MDPKKQIFDAIRENDVNLVRDLIYQIDNLDFYRPQDLINSILLNDYFKTPLILASELGYNEIIIMLLKAGANINFTNQYESAALIFAAENNHLTSVQILLNAGANVNLKTYIGSTPLIKAAEKGHKKIVLALINAGADINILGGYGDGYTALIIAAEYGYKKIVLALINAGANVNILDGDGKTALMKAVEKGHKEIVIMLLNAEANLDIQSKINEETALIISSVMGHKEIVSILLEAGADVNIKNAFGLTALDIAFRYKNLNIVDLIENYIPDDPDQIDSDGFTNLMIVASNGPTYKLREFLKRVKDIDAQDPRGNTALIYAVLNGNLQMAELLLNAGANPLIENLEDKSAYHYMMKSTHSKIRKLGNDVFIASTQSETVTKGLRTYYTRRAAKQFRKEYQGKGEEEEKLRPEFHEYYVECAKEDNRGKVFLLAEILGVPREKIENKSQEEICNIIHRFISLLT